MIFGQQWRECSAITMLFPMRSRRSSCSIPVSGANKAAWFWPTIEAALVTKHHWLVFACDSCGVIIDLDLRVKRRSPTAPIQIAHDDVRCPRCNGHGRTRIVKLAKFPSI